MPSTYLADKAAQYAYAAHESSGQLYNDKPYSYHLDAVRAQIQRFWYLLPSWYMKLLADAGGSVHDLIEDCRVTYNDVAAATSTEVAEISFLLATPKGRNRQERHCDEYYQEIATNKIATFVKIADRLANVIYSKLTGGKMLTRYKEEQEHFELYLRPAFPEFEDMWVELNTLLE